MGCGASSSTDAPFFHRRSPFPPHPPREPRPLNEATQAGRAEPASPSSAGVIEPRPPEPAASNPERQESDNATYKEAVELLLDAGADIDDDKNNTFLANTKDMDAAMRDNAYKEAFELLLSAGADINIKNKDDRTVLMIAALRGSTKVVKLLLTEGAKVNGAGKGGFTALFFASQKGHAGVVEVLLSEGADVHATTDGDRTALMIAAQCGHTRVVELLLSGRAKVNGAKKDAFTPLFLASQEGHAEVVKVLLSAGAHVHATANGGSTALMAAAQYGRKGVVKLLLSGGANVNGASKDGVTALFLAIQEGHAHVAEVLLSEGADLQAKTKKGRTPRDVAQEQGRRKVLQLLAKVDDAPFSILLESIWECEQGPEAPSVGAPATLQGGAPVTLSKLPGRMRDLHEAMPPALRTAPMRLLMIDAVLNWPTIKVYEDVATGCRTPAAAPAAPPEFLDVPYGDVSEEQWAKTLAVSWRWGAQKPAQLQPHFTPMSEPQFRELRQVLRQARGVGLQYVWIDWCCVPQYSAPSMVEVLRSKVFYVRARVMTVIPTFERLPEGVVRLLLVRVRRVLEERSDDCLRSATAAAVLDSILTRDLVAGREYFSRVWTLAERMARHGRREQLNQWLSLEAWLGMVVDAMLRSTEDRSASQVYRKILGQEAGELLDTIMGPLATAIEIGSMDENEGLQDMVAILFCAAVSIWKLGSNLEEAPTNDWLRSYLLEADQGVYQAWSEADRVWAVYTYFCWNPVDQGSEAGLAQALWHLAKRVAGGKNPQPFIAVMANKIGLV